MDQITIPQFILKYVMRCLHLITFAYVFGHVSYDLYFGNRFPTFTGANLAAFTSFIVILILSGLTNMILLIKEKKFEKNTQYEIWKKTLIVKFVITVFLTPLLEKIVNIFTSDESKIVDISLKIRFPLMFLLFLVSPFLRYYREHYLSREKDENQGTYAINFYYRIR